MLNRLPVIFVAFIINVMLSTAPLVARADEDKTSAVARSFVAALKELETALQRYHDLMKAAKIGPQEAVPLCATMSPDAADVAEADQGPSPQDRPSLRLLLKKFNISSADAETLCAALNAERISSEKAKAANLAAVTECKANRVPACDAANEAVAAQREFRTRLEAEAAQ
jgi:hypothetical protein